MIPFRILDKYQAGSHKSNTKMFHDLEPSTNRPPNAAWFHRPIRREQYAFQGRLCR